MQRRSIAIAALVALVTVSALFVPSAARAAATPTPQAVGPAGTDSVATLDRYGGATSVYYSGLGSGQVFFSVTDPSADSNATVRIFDHNASRDGITTPAATFNVLFRAANPNFNNSYLWGIHYSIPVTLTYGGLWNITVTAKNAGFAYHNFTVLTYNIDAVAVPSVNLPAHQESVFYTLLKTANVAPYAAASNVELTGQYYAGATLKTLPSTPRSLGSADHGWYNFTVPTDASGTMTLSLFANTSSGGGNTSASTGVTATIGHLTSPTVFLGSCPASCYGSTFPAGTPVYVNVYAQISSGASPAAGITATFKFERGATFVTPPGNPPSQVTTDSNGHAAVSFLASLSVFSTTVTNTVSVTLTDPLEPASGAVTTNVSFAVYNVTTHPTLSATFGSIEYYSGDTATVQWAIGGTNTTVTAGWVGDYWVAYRSSFQLIGYGVMAAGATSGSFNVPVPVGYVGSISVTVTAHNTTAAMGVAASALVRSPTILLTPSELNYLPGDTVTIGVGTAGQLLSGAALWGTVVDDSGNWISNQAVSGNQLTIHVPQNGAPSGYTVTVTAQSTTAGLIANATLSLSEASGIDLSIWISTPSSYVDGSFQPGQTVTVNYEFLQRGLNPLPKTYTLLLYPRTSGYTGHDNALVQLASSKGSFQYKIPSDAQSGVLWISADASYSGPTCDPYCYTYGSYAVPINTSPAWMGYQIGAGSGLTAGWLILFVLIVLLGIVGLLYIRRRGRRTMVMKPEAGPSSTTIPPPPGGPQ